MEMSVVLPAYQEAENLEGILPRIHAIVKKMDIEYEVIVVDTMEPMDDTKRVCQENHSLYMNREYGNLYGDAIRTGISKARGEYLVIMDADGSHDPQAILVFYEEMLQGNYDLVIGSRYCKGGQTDNNFILRFMSYVLNVSYRVLFGLKVKDISDSYRMYRTEKIKDIKLECDNFDIVEEILIKMSREIDDFRVKEVPISFNKRDKGASKRNLIKFVFSYLTTIRRLKSLEKAGSFHA